MRRQLDKILIWILLILSIISLALAAPASIRDRPEICLDANPTRNVTTASHKLEVERGSHVIRAETDRTMPSPDSDIWTWIWNTPWSQIAQAYRHAVRPPPPSDIPGSLAPDASSSIGDHYVRPRPRPWPARLGLPVGWTPGAGFFSPPPPHSSHHDQPGPPGRAPSLPGVSVDPDTLSTGNNYVPPSPGRPSGSRFPAGSMPVADPLSPLLPPPRHPSQPGPSEDRSGRPVNPDTLSSTGSNEHSQSPGDPEIHSLLNPDLITAESEFWDMFLKGRIKRRMSGSDAVNLAQKDPRFLNSARRRRNAAAMPLHGPLS